MTLSVKYEIVVLFVVSSNSLIFFRLSLFRSNW